MKKLLYVYLSLAACSSAFALDVDSKKDFYVRGDVGASIPGTTIKDATPLLDNSKFKVAPMYNLGVGYNISDYVRTDINIQYRNLKYNHSNSEESAKQSTKNYAVFWNGYFDAKNSSIVTPYLTAGIGFSRISPSDVSHPMLHNTITYKGKATNNFAWNTGIGSKVKLNSNIDLDLAYRYVSLGQVKFNNAGAINEAGKPVKLRAHEITLGLIYNF